MPSLSRTVPTLAAVAALSFAGTAGAAKAPSVSPKKPIVDDSVTITFTPKSKLKAGYHYEASLLGPFDSSSECTSLAEKTSKSRAKTVRITIGSYDDTLGDGNSEFCQGKAIIIVTVVKNGVESTGKERSVASAFFRFYAKP